ncbi:uncharacterized protein LOC128850851 [Cuculus canorus]|uniref:uncharacterized protein LOC128850851 n=1 Tax=Cuculus canorus TaxID=55661 RepID=UPI0023AA4182|nr:uncharacterized protein LOC128850851 [Cuculus canorus]
MQKNSWASFRLKVVQVFAEAYDIGLDINVSAGREARLPLHIKVEGIGPPLCFSFEQLDIGNVFAGSAHSYEVILFNKGAIDAPFSSIPPSTALGSCFTFLPWKGIISSDGLQVIKTSFSSTILGTFTEEFRFRVNGSSEPVPLAIRGCVIGPAFPFDVPSLHFGDVSFALLEGFDIWESTSFIEEHIDRQVSPIESLRLMCLLSITENGLIPKDYRSLKTQYLQSYGPEHLLTFHKLKRIGLLTEQSAAETLTAVESRASKLVTDRAAAESQPSAPWGAGSTALPCWELLLQSRMEARSKSGHCGHRATSRAELWPIGAAGLAGLLLVLFWSPELWFKFIFLTTAITNSARMMEAMIEAKA